MIETVFDEKHNQYNVTISKEDLQKAFASPSTQEFLKLMHDIVQSCYGQHSADRVFPIQEGETEDEE